MEKVKKITKWKQFGGGPCPILRKKNIVALFFSSRTRYWRILGTFLRFALAVEAVPLLLVFSWLYKMRESVVSLWWWKTSSILNNWTWKRILNRCILTSTSVRTNGITILIIIPPSLFYFTIFWKLLSKMQFISTDQSWYASTLYSHIFSTLHVRPQFHTYIVQHTWISRSYM